MICRIKDLEVYYEVHGEGKPFIMLHGFAPDHRLMKGCFEPIFKQRSGYRRIYLDLPGMGKTKSKAWIKNADVMLDILVDFINEIIGDENFLLAGTSYGGYLARGIIHRMPDKVDGLLLLCPCIVADAKKRNRPLHVALKREAGLLERLDPLEAEDFASMAVVQTETVWVRYRDEILSGVKVKDTPFLNNFQRSGYAFSFDVDALQKKFEKPSLMLMGRQDATVGYKDAWSILDNYPRATFAVLDWAGHNLQLEQEELFCALVNEWLDRVNDTWNS